jgi:hypothetical protein
MKMTNKGIITSAQETVVAAGKSAAEGAKAIAGVCRETAVIARVFVSGTHTLNIVSERLGQLYTGPR